MLGSSLDFDQSVACKIVRDELYGHMPPPQASPEKVVLCAQLVEQPLAFPCDGHLCFLRTRLVIGEDELNMPTKFSGEIGACATANGWIGAKPTWSQGLKATSALPA